MGSFLPDIYIFFDIADLLRAKNKIVRFRRLSQNVIITYHPLLCTNLYRIAMLLSLYRGGGVASLGRLIAPERIEAESPTSKIEDFSGFLTVMFFSRDQGCVAPSVGLSVRRSLRPSVSPSVSFFPAY